MAGGLFWLVLGLIAVRSERLRSRPVLDESLLELVDVLRAELGRQRPVEARQADDLVTAAMIGWRRPVVLLPPEWTAWTAQQRRAVLAHEIAHARSQDFLALLLGQIGLVLHFYHPLVHWLMGRLRLEQELAADAAAAGVCGGRHQYLLTIAELALRRQDGPLLWPARAFLPTRTTFLEENCHAPRLEAPPRPALAAGAAGDGRGRLVVRAAGCRAAGPERLRRSAAVRSGKAGRRRPFHRHRVHDREGLHVRSHAAGGGLRPARAGRLWRSCWSSRATWCRREPTWPIFARSP